MHDTKQKLKESNYTFPHKLVGVTVQNSFPRHSPHTKETDKQTRKTNSADRSVIRA